MEKENIRRKNQSNSRITFNNRITDEYDYVCRIVQDFPDHKVIFIAIISPLFNKNFYEIR